MIQVHEGHAKRVAEASCPVDLVLELAEQRTAVREIRELIGKAQGTHARELVFQALRIRFDQIQVLSGPVQFLSELAVPADQLLDLVDQRAA